jgi:hypothetical protein
MHSEIDYAELYLENLQLRRLLASLYSGKVYYNDDEMKDKNAKSIIDFKRDTPFDIERKMIKRASAKQTADRGEL